MSYYTIPENIAIVICSKYSETREPFLRKILAQTLKYGKNKHVIILSDNNNYSSFIKNLGYNLDVGIFVPDISTLPNLFFLPWSALRAFYALLKKDPNITHFLYLEDDLNISPELIHFQTFYLDLFKNTKFFPGAIRVEQTTDETSNRRPLGKWYASDQTSPLYLKKSPVLETNDWYFVPLPNPHQGFYYYTRDQINRLFELNIQTPFRNSSGKIDFGLPREHAAAGLTWDTPPDRWPHRLVVPVCKNSLQIPSICHVHHMGDKYANGNAIWAQLPIEDVIKV